MQQLQCCCGEQTIKPLFCQIWGIGVPQPLPRLSQLCCGQEPQFCLLYQRITGRMTMAAAVSVAVPYAPISIEPLSEAATTAAAALVNSNSIAPSSYLGRTTIRTVGANSNTLAPLLTPLCSFYVMTILAAKTTASLSSLTQFWKGHVRPGLMLLLLSNSAVSFVLTSSYT